MSRYRSRPREPLADRFARFHVVDEATGCWNWTGGISNVGYGKMKIGSRLDGSMRTDVAHRISYRLHKGEIPEGLEIDHLCRNRRCVNPAHLEAVTARENNLRSDNISGVNHRKTHCVRGHALDGDNVGVKANGHRRCKTCQRMHDREAKRRLRHPLADKLQQEVVVTMTPPKVPVKAEAPNQGDLITQVFGAPSAGDEPTDATEGAEA